MASFKLIVPPDVRVINEMHAVMADVAQPRRRAVVGDAPAARSSPVIRLTGTAFMAEVQGERPSSRRADLRVTTIDRPGLHCRRSGTAIRSSGSTD